MIDLYTSSTPNGWKISITLEALGMPHTIVPIRLDRKEEKSAASPKINPNGRIPTIVDRGLAVPPRDVPRENEQAAIAASRKFLG